MKLPIIMYVAIASMVLLGTHCGGESYLTLGNGINIFKLGFAGQSASMGNDPNYVGNVIGNNNLIRPSTT